VTTDGQTVSGAVTGGDAEALQVATDPLTPDRTTRVLKKDIEAQQPSLVSPMPSGLLDTLTKEEILDLLAYLESGGKRTNAKSKPTSAEVPSGL
jgi:hypothetical protein